MRTLWRLIRLAVLLGVVALTITVVAVQYASLKMAERDGAALAGPVDAILVLGAGVDGDGRLGYSSRRRVAGAVQLLAERRTRVLIMTGGVGDNHPQTPAARMMREYALELGADPAVVLVEDRSLTTLENLEFGFAIADAQGFRTLALSSDAYHLTRAQWLADWLGRGDVGLVATGGFDRDAAPDRIWAVLREALAWWWNLGRLTWRDWLGDRPATAT